MRVEEVRSEKDREREREKESICVCACAVNERESERAVYMFLRQQLSFGYYKSYHYAKKLYKFSACDV